MLSITLPISAVLWLVLFVVLFALDVAISRRFRVTHPGPWRSVGSPAFFTSFNPIRANELREPLRAAVSAAFATDAVLRWLRHTYGVLNLAYVASFAALLVLCARSAPL